MNKKIKSQKDTLYRKHNIYEYLIMWAGTKYLLNSDWLIFPNGVWSGDFQQMR